ncbi:hypothetical protein [Streptomyces sp. NPDC008121]|uniref:hypothetical protein n=1 Tax=Streptomyces sp. NPDC008121 TaxID=3364809 RepID=UPI0036F13E8E
MSSVIASGDKWPFHRLATQAASSQSAAQVLNQLWFCRRDLAGDGGETERQLGHADEADFVIAQLFGNGGEEALAAAVEGGELVAPNPEGVPFIARGVLAGQASAVQVADEQAADQGVALAAGRADEDGFTCVHGVPDVVRGAGAAEELLEGLGGVEAVDNVGDHWHRVRAELGRRGLPVRADAGREAGQQPLAPVLVGEPSAQQEQRALLR